MSVPGGPFYPIDSDAAQGVLDRRLVVSLTPGTHQDVQRLASLLRLIVSADFVNEGDGATVLDVHLVDRNPQSLLAPRSGGSSWCS